MRNECTECQPDRQNPINSLQKRRKLNLSMNKIKMKSINSLILLQFVVAGKLLCKLFVSYNCHLTILFDDSSGFFLHDCGVFEGLGKGYPIRS